MVLSLASTCRKYSPTFPKLQTEYVVQIQLIWQTFWQIINHGTMQYITVLSMKTVKYALAI